MCKGICSLWAIMMCCASLCALDSQREDIRGYLIADYSTLQRTDTAPQPHDDELRQHLETWAASKKAEDSLGVAGAHKKREYMQDYADYIAKPPIFYERKALQSRIRP